MVMTASISLKLALHSLSLSPYWILPTALGERQYRDYVEGKKAKARSGLRSCPRLVVLLKCASRSLVGVGEVSAQ